MQNETSLTIKIQNAYGQHRDFTFSHQTRLIDVRQKLHNWWGVPISNQKLIFNGALLENNNGLLVEDLGLRNGATIFLVTTTASPIPIVHPSHIAGSTDTFRTASPAASPSLVPRNNYGTYPRAGNKQWRPGDIHQPPPPPNPPQQHSSSKSKAKQLRQADSWAARPPGEEKSNVLHRGYQPEYFISNGSSRYGLKDEREYKPWFAMLMLASCCIMFVVEMAENGWVFEDPANNPMYGPSAEVLVNLGAKDTVLIKQGEVWRLITPIFLHGGLIHLAANMLGLYMIGFNMEREFGWLRFSFVYIISGLFSIIASALFIPDIISVGASGAIFGIFGGCWSLFCQNYDQIANKCCMLSQLIICTVINLGLGLMPYVDNFAHVGGFITGFCAGFILIMEDRKRHHRNSNLESGGAGWYSTASCGQLFMLWGCLAIVVTLVGVGLIVLYADVNLAEICPGCSIINCVDIEGLWSCDQMYAGGGGD